MRDGFSVCAFSAVEQHRALQHVLEKSGARCHLIEPDETMPDMYFTRDAPVTTLWGILGLRPATQHRIGEVENALSYLRNLGAPLAARVTAGTVDGGEIAIIRPGLVAIGCSGERTDSAATPERMLASVGTEQGESRDRSHGRAAARRACSMTRAGGVPEMAAGRVTRRTFAATVR